MSVPEGLKGSAGIRQGPGVVSWAWGFQDGAQTGTQAGREQPFGTGLQGPQLWTVIITAVVYLPAALWPGPTHSTEASAHVGRPNPPGRGYFSTGICSSPGLEVWGADSWEVPGMPHTSGEAESPLPCLGRSQNSPSGTSAVRQMAWVEAVQAPVPTTPGPGPEAREELGAAGPGGQGPGGWQAEHLKLLLAPPNPEWPAQGTTH